MFSVVVTRWTQSM